MAPTVAPKWFNAHPLLRELAMLALARCPLDRAWYGLSQVGRLLSPTEAKRSMATWEELPWRLAMTEMMALSPGHVADASPDTASFAAVKSC
jgi:hypothetical protein